LAKTPKVRLGDSIREREREKMKIKMVVYHSTEWQLLVEMGWVTMWVDMGNNMAFMFLDGRKS
jgi:hypothetical protein